MSETNTNTIQNAIDDIKLEFLNLVRDGHTGYNISLERACEWLGINCDDQFRRDLKRRYLNKSEYCFNEAENENDENAEYIIKEQGKKKVPYFSNDGFKMFCLIMNKSPKSHLVRKYFIRIEKEYVKMLKMTSEEFEKYKVDIIKQMDEFKKEYGSLENRCVELQDKLNKRNDKISKFIGQQSVMDKQISILKSIDSAINTYYDTIDPDDRDATRRLELYEKRFGKPVYIYLLSDKWVNESIINEIEPKPKKPKKLTKSKKKKDEENEIEEQPNMNEFIESNGLANYSLDMNDLEFDEITKSWIEDYILSPDHPCRDQRFYFYMTKTNLATIPSHMKYWNVIYFIDEDHYKKFIDRIADQKLSATLPRVAEVKNKVLKDTYLTQYDALYNSNMDIIARIAFETKFPKEETLAELRPQRLAI
jgi:hypothetical protein